MRAGLDRISAYRHVPRSTSRVTLPTPLRRFIRPVGDHDGHRTATTLEHSSLRRGPIPLLLLPPSSVPLPSFHPPTIRPSLQQRFFRTQQRALSQRRRKCYAQPMRNVVRRILQRESFYNALLIQLEQTPDSFRVYIRANGTEASFVKSFASFARASLLPLPPSSPAPPPLLLSFAARERKFPRQQLLKLISR